MQNSISSKNHYDFRLTKCLNLNYGHDSKKKLQNKKYNEPWILQNSNSIDTMPSVLMPIIYEPQIQCSVL